MWRQPIHISRLKASTIGMAGCHRCGNSSSMIPVFYSGPFCWRGTVFHAGLVDSQL
jgi:hypothetical protein